MFLSCLFFFFVYFLKLQEGQWKRKPAPPNDEVACPSPLQKERGEARLVVVVVFFSAPGEKLTHFTFSNKEERGKACSSSIHSLVVALARY